MADDSEDSDSDTPLIALKLNRQDQIECIQAFSVHDIEPEPDGFNALENEAFDEIYEELYDSDDDDDDEDESFDLNNFGGLSMLEMMMKQTEIEEKMSLAKRNYTSPSNVSDCLQGEILSAFNKTTNEHVAIKKVSRCAHEDKEAMDEDGLKCIVDEDIVKEAEILKTISNDQFPLCPYIVGYVDFIKDDENYYLITEYVEGDTNLRQFVCKAHKYMHEGLLSRPHYMKIITNLWWQLATTVHWLHTKIKCMFSQTL